MDDEQTQLDMRFPLLGIDVTKTGFDQRPGTSPLAVNVRGFDTTLRQRGGTRPGLNPWFGAGSTVQVSGFHPIQHLACVTTADLGATYFDQSFNTLTVRMDYSESNNPPPRVAPRVETPLKWYTIASPTFPGTSGVLSPPDGGGTGQGKCSMKLSTNGTTVTLVATFISAGFPGPYFFSGAGPVQTLTQTNVNFFNPVVSRLSGSWTVVTGSFIGNLFFTVFYPGP